MSRPLSSIEHVLYKIDPVASQSFSMCLRLRGPVKETVIREALDLLQEKHPPLRWKIKEREGSVPIFIGTDVPKIPLRVFRRRSDDQWRGYVEDGANGPIQWNTGPLAEVILLKGGDISDLVITICHIASDGMSALVYYEDLLTYIGKLSAGETIDEIHPASYPPSSLGALREDITFPEYKPEKLDPTYKKLQLKADKEQSVEQRLTCLVYRTLSKEETERLSKRCREKNTTMHGAICAAYFQALSESYRSIQGSNDPVLVTTLSPVPLRPYYTNPEADWTGYLIGFAMHTQAVNENGDFWDLAVRTKQALNREVEAGKHLEAIKGVGNLLNQYPTGLEMVRSLADSVAPVVTTNLGRMNLKEQYGPIKLEEFYTLAGLHMHATLGGIVISSLHGRLTINFNYTHPYLSRERAEQILNSTMKRLVDATQ